MSEFGTRETRLVRVLAGVIGILVLSAGTVLAGTDAAPMSAGPAAAADRPVAGSGAGAPPPPDPGLLEPPEPLEPVDPAEAAAAKRPVRIPRARSPIKVDGVLDEPAWAGARHFEVAYEVRPGENTPAPARTEVLITYDDRNVFFAFRAHDPKPADIRAHLADRDNFGSDDWVGVILDTFNDERRDFALLVNPLGVQADFIETTGGEESTEWDTIWDAAGQLTEWGYCVEIRVPYSSLRFQRSGGPQVWGFDAIRGWPRGRSHQFGLFPRDRENNCYLCQAVKIEGFDGASPGKNLEVVPTLTATRSDSRPDFPDGDMEKDTQRLDAGVTARWGITPNMVLSGTVNPDFSQVEADALQVSINEPFALWYPEKRPFFMEGADFFATQLNAVYTRTLRDPDWGVKLTGKEGSHTVGAYVVRDTVTNLIFPGNQGSDGTSLDMPSTAAVMRYKYDLGSQYTFGALMTDREGEGYFNRVFGADGDLRFTEKDRLQVQVLGSQTKYPDEVAADYGQPQGQFSDWAMDAVFMHSTRHLTLWGQYKEIGGDFRADLGYMPKADSRGYAGGADYVWLPGQGAAWSRMILSGYWVRHDEPEGGLLDNAVNVSFQYEGQPNQSHARIDLVRKREVYQGVSFDLTQVQLHQCFKPDGHSHAFVNLYYGGRVDYANVRLGRRLRFNPGLTYNLGRHLKMDLVYTFERMNEDAGRLYTANLGQLTATWQFNDRTFLRWTGQYTDYDYNTALYTDPPESRYKQLFNQVLFSYKINPQTVFFLGYSDNYLNDALDDDRLLQSDRTLFMKVGYAFVF